MDLRQREDEGDPEGVEERKSVVEIYCREKNLFSISFLKEKDEVIYKMLYNCHSELMFSTKQQRVRTHLPTTFL